MAEIEEMRRKVGTRLGELGGRLGEDANFGFQAGKKLSEGLNALRRSDAENYAKIVERLHEIHQKEVETEGTRRFLTAVSNYGNALSEGNTAALCLLDEQISTPKEFMKFHDEMILPQKKGIPPRKGVTEILPARFAKGGKFSKKPGR